MCTLFPHGVVSKMENILTIMIRTYSTLVNFVHNTVLL